METLHIGEYIPGQHLFLRTERNLHKGNTFLERQYRDNGSSLARDYNYNNGSNHCPKQDQLCLPCFSRCVGRHHLNSLLYLQSPQAVSIYPLINMGFLIRLAPKSHCKKKTRKVWKGSVLSPRDTAEPQPHRLDRLSKKAEIPHGLN